MNSDRHSTQTYIYSSYALFSRPALVIVIIIQLVVGSVPIITSTNNSSKYTSVLSHWHPTFSRPHGTTMGYFYEAIQIEISTSGAYTFSSSDSTMDTFGCLYNDNFDPRNSTTNLMITDDDGNRNRQFLITANLQSAHNYVLVITTYTVLTVGNFTVLANGPGQINLTQHTLYLINEPEIMVVSPIYSGSLSKSSSPQFVRPNQNSPYYYYQEIVMTIPLTGTYVFSSNSSIDTFGCLYNASFDSYRSYDWLICDDDGGINGQFLITYRVQYPGKYVLVVTTHSVFTAGSYSIQAKGPVQLTLISAKRTSRPSFITATKYSNQSTSIKTIIALTTAVFSAVIAIYAICIYIKNRKAASNQMVTPSTANRNARAHNVPMENICSNITQVNRMPPAYTMCITGMNSAYLEPPPPSYETCITSLQQTNR